MRETLMTAANEACAERFQVERRPEPVHRGVDGWLTAVRAMVFLIAGMLVVSFIIVI
ncbi:MAG: hypothetical protein JWR00_2424 [Rubritepida sp.]|nr:hypothetical protein [Rubritepida sp.]